MTPTVARDRPLVDAVLAGDRDAYRALVERESMSVIGLCTAILRDPDEAQDAAQDAFVQAYRSLATYRGDGTFGAWIGRIATRMAISRAAARGQQWRTESMDASGLNLRDELASPERQLADLEHAEALRLAIQDLPADQRQVVALRFYEDMPLERIAVETRAPLGTVKSRLHRALARLRDQSDLRSAS
ncbi:MAG: sigma-70 family RNA polymerase sigma factor [Chloroflexota bacterium]